MGASIGFLGLSLSYEAIAAEVSRASTVENVTLSRDEVNGFG